MKILYLITDGNKKTAASLKHLVMAKNDEIVTLKVDDNQLPFNYKHTSSADYVMLLKGNITFNKNFRAILEEYVQEPGIYLPLIVLTHEKAKGVLNSCLWNPNLTQEVGVLTHDLALKQIDTTLYGALVPYDVLFNEEYYKPELKYYQHFHILNKYTKNQENYVYGIPKTLLFTDVDLSFGDVSNDDKVANFKLAKEC
jgi:hypothetical protein